MSKKTLVLAMVLAAGLLMARATAPEPACAAGYCFDMMCFRSRDCGRGCVCMKTGTEPAGRCVSFD